MIIRYYPLAIIAITHHWPTMNQAMTSATISTAVRRRLGAQGAPLSNADLNFSGNAIEA